MKKHDTFSFPMKEFLSVAFVLALIATCTFIIASPPSLVGGVDAYLFSVTNRGVG